MPLCLPADWGASDKEYASSSRFPDSSALPLVQICKSFQKRPVPEVKVESEVSCSPSPGTQRYPLCHKNHGRYWIAQRVTNGTRVLFVCLFVILSLHVARRAMARAPPLPQGSWRRLYKLLSFSPFPSPTGVTRSSTWATMPS